MKRPKSTINATLLETCPKLTSYQKDVLKLRFLEEKPVDEIARHFKKTKGTISSQIGRGLEEYEGWFKSEGKALQNEIRKEEKTEEISSKAYKMFDKGETLVQVAIELGLRAGAVQEMFEEYWELKGMYDLCRSYNEIKDNLWIYLKLYERMQDEGITTSEITSILNNIKNLREEVKKLEERKKITEDLCEKMDKKVDSLMKEIDWLKGYNRYANDCFTLFHNKNATPSEKIEAQIRIIKYLHTHKLEIPDILIPPCFTRREFMEILNMKY